MRSLFTPSIIKVSAEDRPSDVAELIASQSASHCVVVEQPKGEFVGVVKLGELGSRPSARIFADLLSPIPSLRVSPRTTSSELQKLLVRTKSKEAVILSLDGSYLGMVTRESLQTGRGRLLVPASRPSEAKRNAQVRTANLDDALEQLENLSYAISHDIRTPLRAIQGYAQTLIDEYGDRLDEAGRDYVRRIARATDRLSRLSRALVAYRGVASAPLRIRSLNTREVIREVLATLQKPSEVTIELCAQMPAVRGDQSLLARAFFEVLHNAVKYSAIVNSPKISISAQNTSRAVTICVADNGPGIRPGQQERIFQLFERANGSQGDESGLGVGLAVARKAVERMGGKLSVRSEVGHGSCFYFRFPF